MAVTLNLSETEAAILMRWIGLAVSDSRSHEFAIDNRDTLCWVGEKLSAGIGGFKVRP